MHALNIRIEGTAEPSWMQPIRDFAKNGALGVNLLHVMSGFLISFLLLQEEKETGQFSILKYYLRRTLRIWPLYFLMLIISFLAIPFVMDLAGKDYQETASPWAYIFFWSNFYILEYGFPYSPILAVLWSVSVEEQFYIGWPWLMRLFRKNRNLLFLIVIIISTGFRIYFRDDGMTLFFHTMCIISDFAIGAFVATLAVDQHPFFNRLKNLPRSYSLCISISVIIMVVFYHPLFDSTIATVLERLLLGIAFAFLIFDQAFSMNRAFNVSNIPGFQWLGKRTYGLYCFHEVGILSSVKFLSAVDFIHSPWQYALLMPLLAFMITAGLAALSYRYFEKPFLDWKERFEMK